MKKLIEKIIKQIKSSPNLQKLCKLIALLVILILFSFLCEMILGALGIIYYDNGLRLNTTYFDAFGTTWYGFFIVIAIQVLITSLLSFVPGASMAFIMLLQTLYEEPRVAFIVAFSGVMLSSLIMYLLGRFGGYNLCKRLLGKEDCEKASELLNRRGLIYFPMMMLFPIFPDDALVMVAGTLRMSLKWFIPSIVIGRGIGVATIIFGLSIVPFESFTTVWHWIGFVLLCLLFILAVFWAARCFNKYMDSRGRRNK